MTRRGRLLRIVLATLTAAAALAACSPMPSTRPDAGGGGCACTITFNGAPVQIACGADACLGSTRFACSDARELAPQGSCTAPAPVDDGGQPPADGMSCTNTCRSANDGECDDGGPGAQYSVCALGTDCADCGPRTAPVTGGDGGGPCTPDCSGRTCGSDGCGGRCGTGCVGAQTCESGQCVGPMYGAPCTLCDDIWATTHNCAVSGTAEVTRQCGPGGWCRRGPFDSAGYCTAPCPAGTTCPSGYDCRDIMVGQDFCVRP